MYVGSATARVHSTSQSRAPPSSAAKRNAEEAATSSHQSAKKQEKESTNPAVAAAPSTARGWGDADAAASSVPSTSYCSSCARVAAGDAADPNEIKIFELDVENQSLRDANTELEAECASLRHQWQSAQAAYETLDEGVKSNPEMFIKFVRVWWPTLSASTTGAASSAWACDASQTSESTHAW
jgi:hypothetical protein